MYKKIINPETGRSVNINGRTGLNVLKTYIKQYNSNYQRGGADWLKVVKI